MAGLDVLGALVFQIEYRWLAGFRPRLKGLTDEEHLWEPVAGRWTLHPIDDGLVLYDLAATTTAQPVHDHRQAPVPFRRRLPGQPGVASVPRDDAGAADGSCVGGTRPFPHNRRRRPRLSRRAVGCLVRRSPRRRRGRAVGADRRWGVGHPVDAVGRSHPAIGLVHVPREVMHHGAEVCPSGTSADTSVTPRDRRRAPLGMKPEPTRRKR